jgi:putative inorganic carbon (hco3(-)) transporter
MLKRIQVYFYSNFRNNAERTAFIGLAGSVSLVLASIAVSQILLATALIAAAWIISCNRRLLSSMKGILIPLILFCLWILVTALAAPNTVLALTFTKKFFLFCLIPLVPLVVRGPNRILWIYRAIITVALLSSLIGIVQYLAKSEHNSLTDRITGFMSHWMTFSGLLMLVLVCTVAFGLRAGGKQLLIWIPIASAIALAILLSLTRSAAIGAYIGVFALFIAALFVEKKRLFVILTVCLILFSVALYFAFPASFQQRFRSGLDPSDDNTRNRIELLDTSVRMIRDNPWFGIGPKNVGTEALRYRNENEFPEWLYQHMHNNVLQIASETGIPGLAVWLWLMIRLLWDSLRTYRFACSGAFPYGEENRREATIVCSAAVGSWFALMMAGVFEYNFGDSEVLTLFLFIMSAPYVYSPDCVTDDFIADS